MLRVAQVKPSGVLVLQGKCGRYTEARQEYCAPCHLPNLDAGIDPVLAFDQSTVCEVCSREKPISQLLICDICARGHHTKCLQPQLPAVPAGLWICPGCVQDGRTLQDAQRMQQQREEALQRARLPDLFPDAATRRRDQQAEQLHDRLVYKSWAEPGRGRKWYWGRLYYRGALNRPNYFIATYEDGDYETLTTAAAMKVLKPASTKLPAGVVIPPLSQEARDQLTEQAAAAQQRSSAIAATVQQQQHHSLPSLQDTVQLLDAVDLSRVSCTADPVCRNSQLQQQLQLAGRRQQQRQQQLQQQQQVIGPSPHKAAHLMQQPPMPAAVYIMAVQPSAAAAAITVALSRQPAFLACFVPAPQPSSELRELVQQQGSAAVLRVGGGHMGVCGSWCAGHQQLAALTCVPAVLACMHYAD